MVPSCFSFLFFTSSRSSPSSPPSGIGHPGTEPPALALRSRASPCVSAPKATSKPHLRAWCCSLKICCPQGSASIHVRNGHRWSACAFGSLLLERVVYHLKVHPTDSSQSQEHTCLSWRAGGAVSTTEPSPRAEAFEQLIIPPFSASTPWISFHWLHLVSWNIMICLHVGPLTGVHGQVHVFSSYIPSIWQWNFFNYSWFTILY